MDEPKNQTLWFFPTTRNHQRLIDRINKLLYGNGCFTCRIYDLKRQIRKKYPMRLLWLFLKRTGLAFFLGLPRDTPWIIPLILYRKRILSHLHNMLSESNVGCIIILDQYISLRHMLCIVLGRMLQVPVVVIPYVCHQLNVIISTRANSKEVLRVSKGLLGRLIYFCNPKWLFSIKKKKILWLDPLSIMGIKLLGLRVETPQRGVNEYVYSLFVASEEARSRLLTCGFSPDRIKIVGDVAYDLFYREKVDKDKKKEVLGLAKGADTVLYSIVPDLKRPTLYGDYRNYLDAYSTQLCILKENGWNVLCNPHPSTSEEAIQRFVDAGFNVSREDMATLLPHADLYITSYSSTLTWCATLGIPAIDHDIYQYGYIGIKHKGIVSVRTTWEFEHLVQKIIAQASEWKAWRENAKKNTNLYGKIDGHVIDRILDGIRSAKATMHATGN